MQATYALKPFPFQIFAFVCGLLAAAIIGAAGGYWLKSLDRPGSSAAAAAAATTARQPSLVGENAAQSAARSSSLYEQGGRPTAVYGGAAALTTGGASMVGENGRQNSVASTQPILDGWERRVAPSRENLHEGHRR